MSFDVFFQGFRGGDAAAAGGELALGVLRAHVAGEDRESHFLHVRYGDGEADIYLHPDSMLANHISGTHPWELLFQAARAADWVVLPSDGPACLTAEAQRAELPEELRDDARLVAAGQELRCWIAES